MAPTSELILDADGCRFAICPGCRIHIHCGKICCEMEAKCDNKGNKNFFLILSFLHKEGSASENDVILLYLDLCLIM